MQMLFLFLDGVGIGPNNLETNPFSRVNMPNLKQLLGGNKLVSTHPYIESERATLLSIDACLGVEGLPQSATGQSTLLTGINVPKSIGYHYGPKPNLAVREYLKNGNLFTSLSNTNKRAVLLNAYPPRYFETIHTGRRLYSAIPLALTNAGIQLKTQKDLFSGLALSADFTGNGWREHLGIEDTPIIHPEEAGNRLASLAGSYDLTLFEYWLTDYAGHRQDMVAACALLETIDRVLQGLLAAWDDQVGLIFITSDHGNLEDLGTHRHTRNPVPALVIGKREFRNKFIKDLRDLTGVTPAIKKMLEM